MEEGKNTGPASEISFGEDIKQGQKKIIYVNNSLKHKGFEFYRDKEGYSLLFVLRDFQGSVIYGAYAPLQSIKEEDGTYLYRSGSATAPGSFPFPQDPKIAPIYYLQTMYYPDKEIKRVGEVYFQGWKYEPGPWAEQQEGNEIFTGKAALGERIRAGDYFLSMDEVRYWSKIKIIYRPGFEIIFISFWMGLGGLMLSAIQKMSLQRKQRLIADKSIA